MCSLPSSAVWPSRRGQKSLGQIWCSVRLSFLLSLATYLFMLDMQEHYFETYTLILNAVKAASRPKHVNGGTHTDIEVITQFSFPRNGDELHIACWWRNRWKTPAKRLNIWSLLCFQGCHSQQWLHGLLIPLAGLLPPAQIHHSHLTKGVEVVQNLSASSSVLKTSLKKQFCP